MKPGQRRQRPDGQHLRGRRAPAVRSRPWAGARPRPPRARPRPAAAAGRPACRRAAGWSRVAVVSIVLIGRVAPGRSGDGQSRGPASAGPAASISGSARGAAMLIRQREGWVYCLLSKPAPSEQERRHADPDRRRRGAATSTQRFETSSARGDRSVGIARSGLERIAIASAFQAEGTALIHMATRIRPDVPILFLETGFHFAETLAFKERLTEQLGLNVVDLTGRLHRREPGRRTFGPRLYERDPEALLRAEQGGAVQPGLARFRRMDDLACGGTRPGPRKHTPIVSQTELEPGKTLVKINPVANWTRPRRVGLPEGARPPAQPAVRPRLRLDRVRPLHADGVPGRGRAGRPVVGTPEDRVRHPRP